MKTKEITQTKAQDKTQTSQLSTSKTTRNLVTSLMLLGVSATVSFAHNTTETHTHSSNSIHVALVSDDSGIDFEKSGVKTLISPDDLFATTKEALKSNREVLLHFVCIDERANAKNDFVSAALLRFTLKPPVKPNVRAMGGSIQDKAKAYKVYRAKRILWLKQWAEKAKEIKSQADNYLSLSMKLLEDNHEKFDQELARRGRDYPRSDIAGIIPLIARKLGNSGRRYLIWNSDGQDTVEWRASRKTSFTQQELPKDIVIITTCKSLQNEPCFKGIPNKIIVVDTISKGIQMAFSMAQN